MINEHANNKQLKEWKSNPGLNHSKAFITNVTKSMSDTLKKLSKDNTKKIIGAFTGHYGTNYILNNIGVTDNPKCRHCQKAPETMQHPPCECNALGRKRMDLFGDADPKPEDYRLLPMGRVAKLLSFAVPTSEQ